MVLADYKEIIHRCFRCGYCKLTADYSAFNCPSYHRFRFETYAPGGMLWLIRAWMNGDIQWSESLAKILYSCTACGNCVEHCKFEFNADILSMILAARDEMVQNGLVVPQLAKFFKNIEATGNPFRYPPGERAKWTEGLEIPAYKEHEYLFFIGCMGSYDDRAQKVTRALATILAKSGVSFGILGTHEKCDGNEVYMLGENRIFDMLSEGNSQMFDNLGIRRIITLSPHAYNAFSKLYENTLEVFHYTQILRDLIEDGKLNFGKKFKARVTYHDPCFLGRQNGEYEAPRMVLGSMPGIKLVEMERNRENAFCCGGGSGNFYIDSFGGGPHSPARARVREAYETGANILAVACPICTTMLSDAVKSEQLEDKLTVLDISEIANAALNA